MRQTESKHELGESNALKALFTCQETRLCGAEIQDRDSRVTCEDSIRT